MKHKWTHEAKTLRLISFLELSFIEFTFCVYQLIYLAMALKIHFVMEVFIEKHQKKNGESYKSWRI